MDDRAEAQELTNDTIDSAADRALDADIATLTDKPATRDRAATIQWLKQRPGATVRWITHRPWLGLPLLAIFPAIAWHLDRTRPPAPETNNPAAIARGTVTPLGSLMPPVRSGQPLPLPGQPLPVPGQASPTPTASPTLQPVDLTKLTPEQKAMNAKAKAALLGAAALVDAQIEMHVAIATKATAIAVGGASPVEVADEKGNVLYNLAANEIYTAQPNGQGMTIGDQSLPPVVFLNAPTTGILLVSNRPYRGRLRLVSQGGQLWAVNHVNMRNYLQSVVASEVSPDWGKESLKAQAVAARSYALTYYFKPANPLYHLGNDEYFQVYSGIEREAATTNAAVDETSGEFVSYKGGIVESLYAASDQIVMEAFQGKGMSQLGAKALANAGYKYEQILSNYYPTTAVGKIVQEF
jgi:stage II sporulation protein D